MGKFWIDGDQLGPIGTIGKIEKNVGNIGTTLAPRGNTWDHAGPWGTEGHTQDFVENVPHGFAILANTAWSRWGPEDLPGPSGNRRGTVGTLWDHLVPNGTCGTHGRSSGVRLGHHGTLSNQGRAWFGTDGDASDWQHGPERSRVGSTTRPLVPMVSVPIEFTVPFTNLVFTVRFRKFGRDRRVPARHGCRTDHVLRSRLIEYGNTWGMEQRDEVR